MFDHYRYEETKTLEIDDLGHHRASSFFIIIIP